MIKKWTVTAAMLILSFGAALAEEYRPENALKLGTVLSYFPGKKIPGMIDGIAVEYERAIDLHNTVYFAYGSLPTLEFSGKNESGTSVTTSISNLTSLTLGWRSYSEALRGFFWGVGVSSKTMSASAPLTVSGGGFSLTERAKASLSALIGFVELGYNLNLWALVSSTSLQVGYVSGKMDVSAGQLTDFVNLENPTGATYGFRSSVGWTF